MVLALGRRLDESRGQTARGAPLGALLARAALAGLGSLEPANAAAPARVVLRTAAGKGAIAPAIRALDEHGVMVESIEVETPTLDDVFAAVTGSHLEGAEARGAEPEAAGAPG